MSIGRSSAAIGELIWAEVLIALLAVRESPEREAKVHA